MQAFFTNFTNGTHVIKISTYIDVALDHEEPTLTHQNSERMEKAVALNSLSGKTPHQDSGIVNVK